MKNVALLALAASLTTAFAEVAPSSNVSGSSTTPLTLRVTNFCTLAYNGFAAERDLDYTNTEINLGTVNAVTSNTVNGVRVLAIDCNRGTALNIHLPSSLTMSNGTDSFQMTTSPWSQTNPLSMSFDQSGSYSPNWGFGNYQYYEVKASFKVGGASGQGQAWSMPGGTYQGELIISFDYDE